MSQLTAQAFGPEGIRGWQQTDGLITKAELRDYLAGLPKLASGWTSWTSMTVVAKSGRGKSAKSFVAYPKSIAELKRFVDETLATL
jgi:hypothetical protein